MLRATVNEAVPLQVLASDGRVDLYVQARLFRGTIQIETLSLPHISGGLYGTTYVSDQEGYISVVYQLFEDSGFTVPAYYDLESEILEVDSIKLFLYRILGLLHENTIFDEQTYDTAQNLLTGRIRSYDTPEHKDAGGTEGLRNIWRVNATYSAGLLSNYSITREL
jgi:hypothetical protein